MLSHISEQTCPQKFAIRGVSQKIKAQIRLDSLSRKATTLTTTYPRTNVKTNRQSKCHSTL